MARKDPKEMCQCIVYHSHGNWAAFDECAFRAKETLDVETAPSWHEQSRGALPEPRTINVCGVHARELRKGKTVDRNTGQRWERYPHHWITEDVRLPEMEPLP